MMKNKTKDHKSIGDLVRKNDTPSNSLKNSNVTPRVEIMEEEVKACSLTRNTSG
jgi:hypothetical protein